MNNSHQIAGKIKKFNKKLCDKYDIKSREIIRLIFGDAVADNPNIYGEDMIVTNTQIPYQYIELQVYGKWESKYPFISPYIYSRKMKFSNSTLFICFNSTYEKMILFGRPFVNPNKHRLQKYSREYIHYIPWSHAMIINTNKLSIDTISEYYHLTK